LLGCIRLGDCVWDVGANVGLYTREFAARVGLSGRVVAVEPIASTFARLRAETSALPQVECVQVALGAREENLTVTTVPESPCNTLINRCPAGTGEPVRITTATKLIEAGCPPPTVLKIDVEGYEEEVLWGFRDTLRDGPCRCVFLEVHYRLLEARGFLRAPSRVVSLLQDAGLRVHWIDPSHLSAKRG